MKPAFSIPLAALAAAFTLAAPAQAAPDQQVGAPPSNPIQIVPNRLIVEWNGAASASQRAADRRAADASSVGALGSPRFQLVRVQSGRSLSDAAAALRARPDVRVVERDGFYSPNGVPNDPLFGQLWGLQNLGAGISGFTGAVAGADIDVVPAWDRTVGTPSTIVADIDSGYRFNHEDLAGVAWTNTAEIPGNSADDDGDGLVDDVHGADFVGSNADSPQVVPDGDPTDDDLVSGGHGVHTAGTIGAQGNNGVGTTGVAQNVRIMPLRACANSPSAVPPQSRCPFSSQIAAINYAGAHGARVANMSLGGTSNNLALRDALAENPQVLFVISAGNDHEDNDATPHYPCNYDPSTSGIPGSIDNVICVAATDQADHLASFSDWGVGSVDVGAPGTEILSSFPDAALFSDNFEVNNFSTNWTQTGGSFAGFARSNEAPLTSFGMTDSPGAAPTASVMISSTSGSFSVPAGEGECSLSGRRFASLGGGSATYQFIEDGGSPVASFTVSETVGTSMVGFSSQPVTGLGGHSIQIRFNYLTPTSPAATNGLWLDDLKVVCITPPSSTTGYDFLQGTSMAAPHVTGAAALLFSLKPAVTVTQVKQALLGTVKPDPALAGKTTTGGRIDVSAALNELVPPPPALPPTPPPPPLPPPPAAPSTPSAPVVKCKVPKLKGKTLSEAKRALSHAHCKLGKVKKPKHAHGKLVVKSSSPSAGKTLAANAKVGVTLAKPKPHKKKKH